jgi:serine protease AprX
MKKLNFLLIIFVPFICLSQTKEQRSLIIKSTDTEGLFQLSKQFNSDRLKRKERINAYLTMFRFTNDTISKDRVVNQIYDVLPNGEVEYFRTSNSGSSITSRANRLYSGASLGLNIQGQGMDVYVWDAGSPRVTHTEFPNGKVVSADGAFQDDHAAHVMGTIVAQGIDARLRGTAFDAKGYSYSWDNDYTEMASEAANGMLVSNHSYGISPTSSNTPWYFGAYNSRASNFDAILYNAPYYLAVAAAGNDGNKYNDPVIGPFLNSKGGYNLIYGMQTAKNILTVGAVNNVPTYNNPSSVTLAAFSSWGPTDDGRIKPEIVAKGVSVRSTDITSDTASQVLSGTSMASPSIAGVAILLQQYFYSLNTNFMRAATLKGLMMHSADETGLEIGPDYQYGWGLVNAENAASIIKSKNDNTAIISELQLDNGQSYTTTLSATGANPLMVSISWTDPAVGSNNSVNDPSTLYLKNDLDLRITKDGETFFPWTLDPANPDNQALRSSDNFRDNFEKIQIDNPNGVYNITVTHKNSIQNGQKFSLIASSLSPNGISLDNSDFVLNESPFFIYPNPTNDILFYSFSNLLNLESVLVTDVSGKRLFFSSSNLSDNQINVSDYLPGIYFISFSSSQGTFTKKFIKK